jgi:hypothetical protein
MVFIDAHLDLAWNALNWNRDLTRTVPEIRHDKKNMKEERHGRDTVSFPEMRKGEIAVCLATVLARASGLDEPLLDFCSRSRPWRSGDRPQAKGIGEQVRQALRNIEAILHAAGSDKEHVMRCGVFLADIRDFDAINHVYAEFFGRTRPPGPRSGRLGRHPGRD